MGDKDIKFKKELFFGDWIYYIHPYYPKGDRSFGVLSRAILSYKDGKPDAVTEFSTDLENALDEFEKEERVEILGRTIMTVPSHEEYYWSHSLVATAGYLSVVYNLHNASMGLVRTKRHDKLAYGGDRSINSHLESIEVDPDCYNKIKGHDIIVLDDVTTTGNSLRACKKILEDKGARDVILVSIARTIRS